ncbi:hypothetical protein PENSPDRAFT_739252 [Peniophora sp. CONT]|nr:hypothetical protein PENSPDRAFT_739252 [Peniophora sp. CONT]
MSSPREASVGFRYPARAGRPLVTSMPSVGDFVVLSLNPLLSVAHLDSLAREEAACLRPGKYIALFTKSGQGIPLKTKPTNEYYMVLVRDVSRSPADVVDERFHLPRQIASLLASPISPYNPDDQQDNQEQVVRPVVDFPRPKCELDLAFGPLCVRVTTASRDCSEVLSLPTSEVVRMSNIQQRALDVRETLEDTGDISSDFNPRPDPDITMQQFAPSVYPSRNDRDDVESLLSASGSSGRGSPREMHEASDLDDTLKLISALLKHPGHKNVPVVDVQYDLSSVEDIADPSVFMRERRELYQIVERATRRMLHGSTESLAEEPEIETEPKQRSYWPHHHHADTGASQMDQIRQPAEQPYVPPVPKETYASKVRGTGATKVALLKSRPRSNSSPYSPVNGLSSVTEKASVVSKTPLTDDKPAVNGRSRAQPPASGRSSPIAGLGKGRGPKAKRRAHAQGKQAAEKRGGVRGKVAERAKGALLPR